MPHDCVVCLGVITNESDPVSIPCGHIFCNGCLQEFIANSSGEPICPVCRVRMKLPETADIRWAAAARPYVHPGIRRVYLPERGVSQSREDIRALEALLAQANEKIDELTRSNQAAVDALEAECAGHLQAQRELESMRRRERALAGPSAVRTGWNMVSRVWPLSYPEQPADTSHEDTRAAEQERLLREKDAEIREKDRMIEELTERLRSVETTAATPEDDVPVVEEDVALRAIAHPTHPTPPLPSISTAIAGVPAIQTPTPPVSPAQTRPRRNRATPAAVHTPQAVDPSRPACEPGQVHVWRKRGSNGSSSRYTCTRCGFFTSEKKDDQGQWYTWKPEPRRSER